MGKELNLDNPTTLSEKIQWLKLYDSTYLKAYITDKITFKDWLKSKIGEGYSPNLLQICNQFKQIDFNSLPNEFVIKVNNSFKKNVFIYNKIAAIGGGGVTLLEKLTKKWLKDKHAFYSLELHYADIKPKLLVEELICKREDPNVLNYQFFCFNGEPKFIEHWTFIGNHKYECIMHDLDWNILPFFHYVNQSKKIIPKPKFLNKMIEISRILSKEFKFVRVDFMCLPDKIYVLELTFTPHSGFLKFQPEEYDEILGGLLNLND